jgi:uncharacterized membrane protein SpoIIM required for sporulation
VNLKRWLAEREPEWKRMESLLAKGHLSIYRLSASEIRELSLLYRSLVNDLSRVRSSADHQPLTPYLNNLAQRVHAKVYERPPTRWTDILRFFTDTFPQCFRRHSRVILAAFLAFALGSVLAMLTVYLDPKTAEFFLPSQVIELVRSGHLWTEHIEAAPSESTFLMTNNIRVAIMAYAMGLFWGVGTLLVMLQNGMFAFGGPLQVCAMYGMEQKLLMFMLPHGVIELTTIMIAGGAGMIIGLALLFPGPLPRWESVRQSARDSLVLIFGCIPLLVIAGIIEGMVSTNQSIPNELRILVSAGSAVFLILYLGFFGRTPKVKTTQSS